MKRCGFLGIGIFALLAVAAAAADPIFQPLLNQLRQKCAVPLRLPDRLPDLGQGNAAIYAVADRISAGEYRIYIAFTPDCNGASVCRMATLAGRRGSRTSRETGAAVRLQNGIAGIYSESQCGANCSDAVVSWREGAYKYSVGVKAGSERDAIRLANACLKR